MNTVTSRRMEEGQRYIVNPPPIFDKNIFPQILCYYQVRRSPNKYVVRGRADSGKEETFVVVFDDKGVIRTEPFFSLRKPYLVVVK